LTAQILRGLQCAHAAGFIHADLKCDNVLIQVLPDGELAKVIDFGIAQLMGRRRPPSHGGRIQVAGTPQYMAPEVIRGEPASARTDVYAAGVLLYQLVCGTVPFTGERPLDIMMQHLHAEVEPPSARRPDGAIAARLDRAILRALAKRPDDRFDDAAAFLRAIEPLARAAPRIPDNGSDASEGRDIFAADSELFSVATPLARGSNPPAPRSAAAPHARAEASAEPGAPVAVIRGTSRPVRQHIEHARHSGRAALARGDLARGLEDLREATGRAIRAGNGAAAVQCYIDLVVALDDAGLRDPAIRELEEAIALLDVGPSSPRDTWRLYLMLARLYEREGQPRSAWCAARSAVARAERVFAVRGAEQAGLFVLHLKRTAPDADPRLHPTADLNPLDPA
jgi:tetratricopeptide (TPR) repeat protein